MSRSTFLHIAVAAALAIGLPLIGAATQGTPPISTYELHMTMDDGNVYVIDHGLTADDCAAAIGDESMVCRAEVR
jgi:adenine/guanine phosphoribosyltransferase-like PRPP-binding protein